MAEGMRLDKWLKIACLFKHRSDATEAVENGNVKLGGERVKPAKMVKVGDVLTIKRGHFYHDYTVLGLSEKSVSRAEARLLYQTDETELDPEIELMREVFAEERRNARSDWREAQFNKKQQREMHRRKYDGF